MTSESEEAKEIQSLLDDFPTKTKHTPEQVIKKINVRYNNFDVDLIKNAVDKLKKSPIKIGLIFEELPTIIHQLLCQDIFSNGGEFRKCSDPNEGNVYFGPSKHRGIRIEEFIGCHPDKIKEKINRISVFIKKEDNNPILSVSKYYHNFVYIHPFYDLNGRIGRLLSSIYLGYHGLYIIWGAIESIEAKKRRFISLLNKCHRQLNKPSYEHKLNSLCKFWAQYIVSIDDQDIILNENKKL